MKSEAPVLLPDRAVRGGRANKPALPLTRLALVAGPCGDSESGKGNVSD